MSAPDPRDELAPIAVPPTLNGNGHGADGHDRPGRTPRMRGRVADLGSPFTYRPEPALVRDIIPRRGVGILAGQSGSLKTFMAIELAHCVALGLPFAGRPIDAPGGVLFVAAEGEGSLPGRVAARRSRLNDPGAVLPFRSLAGFGAIRGEAAWDDFGCTLAHAARDMAAIGPRLALVVIDTVTAAGMLGRDAENDAGAWNDAFEGCQRVAAAQDCAVLLVHHFGKNPEAGLRGSSGARGGADFALAITCRREGAVGRATDHHLHLFKHRDADERPLGAVRHETVRIGEHPDGEPVTSLVLTIDTDAPPPVPKAKRSAGALALDAALAEALIANGETIRAGGHADGPKVRAVRVPDLRAEFARAYTSGEEGEVKAASLTKAFKRNLDGAKERGELHAATIEGTEWAWPA